VKVAMLKASNEVFFAGNRNENRFFIRLKRIKKISGKSKNNFYFFSLG
jgi:hypothetical protein